MDRQTVYRDELPYETDVLLMERYAYEALGLLALDILGSATVFGGLGCSPTAPASLAVQVAPGRIYTLANLEPTEWGVRLGTGGLGPDTNADHKVLKQGLYRDTTVFAITPPVTVGQSRVDLLQAQFVESDSAPVVSQFYNSSNPNAPISADVSQTRLDKCVVSLKLGTPATTGAQTAPTADAGWIPLWAITTANGATSITGPNIAAAAGAPAINIGGGGGGGGTGLSPWSVVNSATTIGNGARILADTSGGPFTITLPAAPAAGWEITVKVNGGTNNLTLGRNGKTIAGAASNLILNQNYITANLVYDGSTWRV